MKLVWSPYARSDRDAIFSHIEADSPRAAVHVDEQIGAAVRRLIEFPESGRPGRIRGTRELVIPRTPYIISRLTSSPREWSVSCASCTGLRYGRSTSTRLNLMCSSAMRPSFKLVPSIELRQPFNEGYPKCPSRATRSPCPGNDGERLIASGWCGRRDSNPHNFRHWNLNPARLPVPPRPQHAPAGPLQKNRFRLPRRT